MQNFEFYNPTRLIFGKEKIETLSKYLPLGSKIMLLYGKSSIKKNGIYDKVKLTLKSFNHIEFGGIEPNPVYETLMQAVELARKEKVDFLLPVGGGSVIDGAKFIAAAIPFEGSDPWTIVSEKAPVKSAVPFGTILTLPATGSEMNSGAVITRNSTKEKFAFGSVHTFPKFSILDISVLNSLPKNQIANGIADAFIHTTEQYMTYPINAQLQDRMAESILKTLISEGPKVLSDNIDEEAGANFMYSATMALNGIISMGVPTDWSIHIIGHELTVLYGIDHGRTLAIILPSLYKRKIGDKIAKLSQFAERVWNINNGSNMEKALKAIEKTEEFFNSVGISTHLKDYGDNIDLEFTVKEIISRFKSRNIKGLGEKGIVTLADIENILRDSW
ncbi:MAG: iron-containing alcohol dehydrogenase [Saprospiraceae bacterium]|nr:iron-containing alcohol dehydrogenase [Saprospiraceae bacterium]